MSDSNNNSNLDCTNSRKGEIEIFCDSSYYDMWCVRYSGDRSFDSPWSFHFMKKEDAEEFKRLLEIAR